MGDFKAGTWIISLAVYFFFLFLIVTAIINASITLGFDTAGINVDEPSFLSDDTNPDGRGLNYRNATIDSGTTANMGSIFDSLGFLTGFGAHSVDYGIPSGWVYVFALILFWIPFFMLLWSIYMALPFMH